MQAIVLASKGYHSVVPHNNRQHAAMVKLGTCRIIDRIMLNLRANGIHDIAIVIGAQHKMLSEYVNKSFPSLNLTIVREESHPRTNNLESLKTAFQHVSPGDDTVIVEANIVCSDIAVANLLNTTQADAIGLTAFKTGMHSPVVSLHNNSAIEQLIVPERQSDRFAFVNTFVPFNFLKLSRSTCEAIAAANDSTPELMQAQQGGYDISIIEQLIKLGLKDNLETVILNEREISSIGSQEELRQANYNFNADQRRSILDNSFGGGWALEFLDFYFIRNMYFPTGSIIANLRHNLPQLLWNYGSKQNILNEKLSLLLDCQPEHVILLNGASQIYPILESFIESAKLLLPKPTFAEYSRLSTNLTTYCDQVGIDKEEIEEKAVDNSVIVFVNPNNPTGSIIESEWIFHFAKRFPDRLCIVDESFIEFSTQQSLITFLRNEPLQNLLIIKSLSKAFGVPGARIGYTYSCNSSLNEFILSQIPIWNCNSFAEYLLELMIKHRAQLEDSFQQTIRDRQQFASLLTTVDGVQTVFESHAEFLLVQLHDSIDAEKLADRLMEKYSIYIKNISYKFDDLKVYIRLAVRLPEENRYIVECLRDILSHDL